MKNSNCPICFSEMEVRDTTPCYVCGCWHEDDTENENNKDNFDVYGLIDNTEITLCKLCYLEDVLSNQGDLISSLNIRPEEASFSIRFLDHASPNITKDKYCPSCKKRFSLLKVIKSAQDSI